MPFQQAVPLQDYFVKRNIIILEQQYVKQVVMKAGIADGFGAADED